MSTPWDEPCFTAEELAELHDADAIIDTPPATTVYRTRAACPRCGEYRFNVRSTKTSAAEVVTRYCNCRRCGWAWRLIDEPAI